MPRDRLTERRVAQTALDLIDEVGIDAFTMRKLADALGVAPMSLYTYFPDKRALLSGVTQLLMAEVEAPSEQLGWREVVRRIMFSVRDIARRHPSAAVLIGWFPPTTIDALAYVEAGFRALHHAGFDDLSAARCYRALAAYAIGSLQMDQRGYFATHPVAQDQASIGAATLAKVLPRVAEVGPLLAGQDDEEEFEYGLDLILDGFARHLPAA